MAKAGIHPNYQLATITCACGAVHETASTRGSFAVEICSRCHPFYTGRQKLMDAAGRIERFNRRYQLKPGALPAAAEKPKAEKPKAEKPAKAEGEKPAKAEGAKAEGAKGDKPAKAEAKPEAAKPAKPEAAKPEAAKGDKPAKPAKPDAAAKA